MNETTKSLRKRRSNSWILELQDGIGVCFLYAPCYKGQKIGAVKFDLRVILQVWRASMRSVPRWRALIPTGRDIRFSTLQWLDRTFPSVCSRMSFSTQSAEFEKLAVNNPLTIIETAEKPFPKDWLTRFREDFSLEHGMEGRVSESAELKINMHCAEMLGFSAIQDRSWTLAQTAQLRR